MSNLSFSALGFGPKVKRTVAQVCTELTRELEEIQQEQSAEAARLSEEVSALLVKQQEAQQEATRAGTAVQNIMKLFGG